MADRADPLPLFSDTASLGTHPLALETRLSSQSSLSAAIHVWEEALVGAGRSPHTVKAFAGDLRLLGQFLGAGQSINAVGTADVRRFLDWMAHRRGIPCSPKTYSRRVTSVKAFFRWLAGNGVIGADPAEAVPQQTVLSPLPDVLTPYEMAAVSKTAHTLRKGSPPAPPDARPAALVNLLLHSGIKKGECLSLQVQHIDLDGRDGPTLFVRYGEVRKRYKERKLSLDPAWVSVYLEYLKQYAPRQQVFPWSPRRLEYILEDLGQAAGLGKHLSFDMCRWTCALHDYRAGMDHDRIRQKLGISKIQWREVGSKLESIAARER